LSIELIKESNGVLFDQDFVTVLLLLIGQGVDVLPCLFHASDTASVMTGCQNLSRAQV
jgi:hypothetical protein